MEQNIAKTPRRVSFMLALDENNLIGKDGGLPWHLPRDLKYFKEKTLSHSVIMGRKTFEATGKPLPGRRNIVVTRRADYAPEGVEVARSIETALELTRGEEEVFIIGGAEICRLALAQDLADRMYLTRIHAAFDGDVYFPEVDWSAWNETRAEFAPADAANKWDCTFYVFDRKH